MTPRAAASSQNDNDKLVAALSEHTVDINTPDSKGEPHPTPGARAARASCAASASASAARCHQGNRAPAPAAQPPSSPLTPLPQAASLSWRR